MLERLGDKAWQPWQAFEELDRDPVLLAPYMGHAMPALLRRSYFQAFVGTDVARSSDYENIRLNPGSVYDQPPIVTKMGKVHDIAKKAREPDSAPPDDGWAAAVAHALDFTKFFTSTLVSLRPPLPSAPGGRVYQSPLAYDTAKKRTL